MSMKIFFLLFSLFAIATQVWSQNPISPAGIYFADPSAKVWPDGKLYLYGSLDENCEYYCSKRHHVFETSDMQNWVIHKDIFMSEGEKDEVSYNDNLLFAPDCAFKNDTFYLYYCQPSDTEAEGVAVSESPVGPFTNGKKMDLGGFNEIDPSVFIDDDGQAYYIWGQFSLKIAKMKPGMREIDKTSIKTDLLTEKEHFFHEGAFLTKRNGIYYLVYADISRGEKPSCLGYARSSSPFGPYIYSGVIVDNDECNPGNWNNHGSIAEFNKQWYVFYHRSTHGCDKMRKTCVEPIYFEPDGSIPEVEMTSQGAGGPIASNSIIQAEQACILHGDVLIQSFSENEEELARMSDNDKALWRYIEFSGYEKNFSIRIAPGKDGGTITLSADKTWHQRLATIKIDGNKDGKEWQTISYGIESIEGIHGIYLQFFGEGEDMFSIDWFSFN